MDIEHLFCLPAHRKRLVLAAESAIEDAGAELSEKTQLNRLISICGEATCAEEITSYLRYQASRKTRPWPPAFANTVMAKIEAPLQALIGELGTMSENDLDRARVAAWRLYAMFLARAFTYTVHVRDSKKGRDHDRARR
jgi:hypothetical protein